MRVRDLNHPSRRQIRHIPTWYEERHLSNGDYHLEEGKVQGEFIGALAEESGLNDKPILKGDPRFRWFAELDIARLSGRNLKRPRNSERQAMEFVYSAPKSVSVAAVLDTRIVEQMGIAVTEELSWYESFACCRDRRGALYDSEAARRTGKMLAAAFVHETSRAKDPDLHIHVLIANVTIDPERNEALAMSYGEMLEMRRTLDHRIHNNLARRLNTLGYTVEVAQHGFRLREIPVAIEEIHSVRSREIKTAKELLKEGYTSEQLLCVISCGIFIQVHRQKARITRLITKPGSSPVVQKRLPAPRNCGPKPETHFARTDVRCLFGPRRGASLLLWFP